MKGLVFYISLIILASCSKPPTISEKIMLSKNYCKEVLKEQQRKIIYETRSLATYLEELARQNPDIDLKNQTKMFIPERYHASRKEVFCDYVRTLKKGFDEEEFKQIYKTELNIKDRELQDFLGIHGIDISTLKRMLSLENELK